MSYKRALWEQNFFIWGQSKKTGKKYRIQTRSAKYIDQLIFHSIKYAIIFNNSICISLGDHKGISNNEIYQEWAEIKKFWSK